MPETTCGEARPEVTCPGSCAQTLDGVVGVGLSSCTCMDTGSGFGAQWVCDTTACPDESDGTDDRVRDDGGMVRSDGGATPTDAGSCPPATVSPPSEPGCTTEQWHEIRSFTSQEDYDAFVTDPSNTECNACLSQAALACATTRGCDVAAGELMCCLDDACGEDAECRSMALTGVCEPQADELTLCVSSISACALNPMSPPPECFP